MKIKTLMICAVSALLLSACGGPGEGKPLEEINNPTTADSLAYFYGEQYAIDYWANARQDSSLTSPEARQAYLKGVQDALKMAGKDDNYVNGYLLGVSIVSYMENFKREFGFELNVKPFMEGIAYGMRSDSIVNSEELFQSVNMLVARVTASRDKESAASAEVNLKALAKKKGYAAMGKDLYGKITLPGQGDLLSDGDRVEVTMTLTDADGKSLGRPMPTEIVVGRQYRNLPFNAALLKLKPGGSGTFATSAFGTFGSNAGRYKLDPAQPLLFSITVKKLLGKEEAKDAKDVKQTKQAAPAPDAAQPADAEALQPGATAGK